MNVISVLLFLVANNHIFFLFFFFWPQWAQIPNARMPFAVICLNGRHTRMVARSKVPEFQIEIIQFFLYPSILLTIIFSMIIISSICISKIKLNNEVMPENENMACSDYIIFFMQWDVLQELISSFPPSRPCSLRSMWDHFAVGQKNIYSYTKPPRYQRLKIEKIHRPSAFTLFCSLGSSTKERRTPLTLLIFVHLARARSFKCSFQARALERLLCFSL